VLFLKNIQEENYFFAVFAAFAAGFIASSFFSPGFIALAGAMLLAGLIAFAIWLAAFAIVFAAT
jgi:hypothetical protein